MADPGTIKHYQILSRLGEGGMGVVYRARDTRLGRTVALKVLPADLARDPEREARFEREARLVSSISHPGIATLYDFDREGDTAFLTMEYVEGPTLREVLKSGPPPVDEVLEAAVQIAEALSAAHAQGIVHRDLKPENIMRSPAGHYKVLDFGVARQVRSVTPAGNGFTRQPTAPLSTRAGTLLGTLAYMSPEQTLGRETDARSDIFSLGSVLYELATGRHAFTGANEIAVAQAVSFEEPPAMATVRPGLPLGLEAVVRRCLAKKPDQRYPSANDLVADLRVLRLDSQSGVRTTSFRLKALEPARRRRRRMLTLAGAGLVALALAAVPVTRWLQAPGAAGGGPGSVAPAPGTVGAPAAPPPLAVAPAGAAAAATGTPRIIVAFFANNSGEAGSDWLSRGLPDMMTTDLSGWPGFEVIAPQRIYDLMAMAGHPAGEVLDRNAAAELARWAGASLVITGSVFKSGERYRIDAAAYDTGTGTVRVAHNVVGDDPFVLVGELAEGLRQELQPEAEAKGPEIEMATTGSAEAYGLYLAGRELYDRMDYTGATERFREALANDPGFSRARLRLAMALLLDGENAAAGEALSELQPVLEGLPEDARLAGKALTACFGPGPVRACPASLDALAKAFPEDTEVEFWYGRALARVKGDSLEAARHLRAALDRDPNNLPAVAELAATLAALGAADNAVAVLTAARERNPAAGSRIQALIDDYKGS